MRKTKCLNITLILGAIFFTHSVFAYNAGSTDKKCKVPKIMNFNPPEKTKDTSVPEVAPESEVGFTVSGNADPTTITAVAKKEKLDLNVIDKHSFYQVSAKLPSSISGKYARIDIRAKAQAGPCVAKDGWLIKVNKAGGAEPAAIEK